MKMRNKLMDCCIMFLFVFQAAMLKLNSICTPFCNYSQYDSPSMKRQKAKHEQVDE